MADNPNSILDDTTMKRIGDLVRSRACRLVPSQRIRNAMKVELSPPTKTGQIGVKLVVKTSEVPYARAMEYGSGTHSQRNFMSPKQKTMKGTVLIQPKKSKILAFHWDKLTDRRDAYTIAETNKSYKEFYSERRIAQGWKPLAAVTHDMYGNPYSASQLRPRVESGVSGKIRGMTKDGKVLMSHVDHPGIQAVNNGRGYMRPALAESKDDILKLISEDALKSMKLKIRAIFSRPGGINK